MKYLVLFGWCLFAFPALARYVETTVEGKVVVLDEATGLSWTSEYASEVTWQQALAHCEGLSYGGHTDWRLPNKNELASLIHYGKYDPASDFPNAGTGWFWSSSSLVGGTDDAWSVGFDYGYVSYGSKYSNVYARCVRP